MTVRTPKGAEPVQGDTMIPVTGAAHFIGYQVARKLLNIAGRAGMEPLFVRHREYCKVGAVA